VIDDAIKRKRMLRDKEESRTSDDPDVIPYNAERNREFSRRIQPEQRRISLRQLNFSHGTNYKFKSISIVLPYYFSK
jgi:hypothetical protein